MWVKFLRLFGIFDELRFQRFFRTGDFHRFFKITIANLVPFSIDEGDVLSAIAPINSNTFPAHSVDEILPTNGLTFTYHYCVGHVEIVALILTGHSLR